MPYAKSAYIEMEVCMCPLLAIKSQQANHKFSQNSASNLHKKPHKNKYKFSKITNNVKVYVTINKLNGSSVF